MAKSSNRRGLAGETGSTLIEVIVAMLITVTALVTVVVFPLRS